MFDWTELDLILGLEGFSVLIKYSSRKQPAFCTHKKITDNYEMKNSNKSRIGMYFTSNKK